MIAGIFHTGSGLGNQLHRYVATRVLALDKGYEWDMIDSDIFKGKDIFPNIGLKYDHPLRANGSQVSFQEKKVVENDVDIRGYDPEINFVQDNTILDGEFQDERYFKHRLNEVGEWLKVEPLHMRSNLCVIGFRGGEFSIFPDLFLTREYWDTAIKLMKEWNPSMEFEVHTDDPVTAKAFFPAYKIIHDIGLNWRSVRYAKYLILANSSFYIFPALLGEAEKVIVPRYWARRNTKTWALPQNYYSDPRFLYI